MRLLIGVDDTDNLESRGTGHRVRQLASALNEANVAAIHGITRHQLLVDPRIPYTSHNSSACLTGECAPDRLAEGIALCRDFLLRESAPGSDAGLCVAAWEQITADVQAWGARAKVDVLLGDEAMSCAQQVGAHLEGLTGTGGGVIGALAAVGLHGAGNDGRYLWLRGLRELSGVYTVAQLCAQVRIDGVEMESGEAVAAEARIAIGDWPRPIRRGGQAILLVEATNHGDHDWHVISKDRIKQLTG